MTWLLMIGIMIFLFLSAFFSGAETGSYRVNTIRLQLRSEAGEHNAVRLRQLLKDPQGFLAGMLIGTNIANYLTTILMASILTQLFTHWSNEQIEVYTTLILVPIIFVFGEMVPKNWFRQEADRLMLICSRALSVSMILFRWTGAIGVLKWMSSRVLRLWGDSADWNRTMHPRRQIAAMLQQGVAEGVMTDQQSRLIDNILTLSNTTIGSVMIPYHRIITLQEDSDRGDVLELIRHHRHSRYPVTQVGTRKVIGVIDVYDMLADPESASIAPYITQPLKISPHAPVSLMLYRMRLNRQTYGVVVDRWDNCIGLVTIKDLTEEVVGELAEW